MDSTEITVFDLNHINSKVWTIFDLEFGVQFKKYFSDNCNKIDIGKIDTEELIVTVVD